MEGLSVVRNCASMDKTYSLFKCSFHLKINVILKISSQTILSSEIITDNWLDLILAASCVIRHPPSFLLDINLIVNSLGNTLGYLTSNTTRICSLVSVALFLMTETFHRPLEPSN